MVRLYIPSFDLVTDETVVGLECMDMFWEYTRLFDTPDTALFPWEWTETSLEEQEADHRYWEADTHIMMEAAAERAYFSGGGMY